MTTDVTPSLDEFRRAYNEDDNVWWGTACGHHQNLFEAACDELDEVRKELGQVRAELAVLRGDELRETLTWEDHEWNGRPTGATSKGKKTLTWSVGIWGGSSLDAPTYSLSVAQVLIIAVDIPSICEAKALAQRIQNALDGAPEPPRIEGSEEPAPALTRNQLVEALQDAWNEWCGDAGAIPDCFVVRGPHTTRLFANFQKEPNFLDAILWRVNKAIGHE